MELPANAGFQGHEISGQAMNIDSSAPGFFAFSVHYKICCEDSFNVAEFGFLKYLARMKGVTTYERLAGLKPGGW